MHRPDRESRIRRRLLAALFLVPLSVGNAAGAEETPRDAERLRRVEEALEADRDRVRALEKQAAALAAEITGLQKKMVAAAAAAQDHEERMTELEGVLAGLEESMAERRAALDDRRGLLTQTLAALQRLSLQPPEALFLGPDAPIDTVRSAMLLKVAIPALKEQAAMLRHDMDALRSLGEETTRRREELAAAAAGLQADRARIARLIDRKRALQRTTVEERAGTEKRIAALAQKADDLRDLLARLKQAPVDVAALPPVKPDSPSSARREAKPAGVIRLPAPENLRPFPTRPASLTPPVRGHMAGRFGEPSPGGLHSKGITIATRAEAQVVSPFDGQVVFRGPFRGYGEILIIEHRGGYHTLLVGLGRTEVAVGQWLLAGEPVGTMGPATDTNPELYLELRHGGEPIDPLPWLRIRDSEAIARE